MSRGFRGALLGLLLLLACTLPGQAAPTHRYVPPLSLRAWVNTLPVALRKAENGLPRLPPVRPEVFSHGSRAKKEIALTFDACSTRGPGRYDARITKILVETGTPATIFLGGKWMADNPGPTKYLASLPRIELGNHTALHPHLTRVSDARVREELARTQAVMYALTGRQATLFRPPYGEYNDRVVRLAAEMGLKTVEYDLPSGDPDPHATRQRLVDYVTWKARDGSVIVMHINGRGWHTAEALPEIIARLRMRGFTFKTVGELMAETAQSVAVRPAGRAAKKRK